MALSFGTAFHAAINEMLMTDPGHDAVTEVFRDILQHDVLHGDAPVLFDDGEDLGKCIDLGTNMLAEFRRSVPMPDEVVGLEVPFSIELHDPATGEVLGFPLIGAMDAIVVERGKNVLLEFKTSKTRWSEDQLRFDQQVTAYQIGARTLGIEAAALKLVITTKAKNPVLQQESVTRTRRDEHELATTAASVMRAVDAGVDHPIRGWHCRGCPYGGRCA